MNNYNLGVQNMSSVLNELSILNGNLVGSTRTGYKNSTHYYGGTGVTQINGLQTPDTNLTTSHTALDFSQGNITQTGEKTDMAINGNGFFAVQQPQDVGVVPPNLLTRDGSFHFATIAGLGTVLTTYNGLVALKDTSGTGAGPFAPITQANFLNNNERPSILEPNDTVDSLKFSKNGSTVFDNQSGLKPADGLLVEGALEASNTDLASTMAAMSLNTKKFQAMAVEIKVEQSSIDTVLGLFK